MCWLPLAILSLTWSLSLGVVQQWGVGHGQVAGISLLYRRQSITLEASDSFIASETVHLGNVR